MKILFFDSLFPAGHRSINNCYLRILSKTNNNVLVCAPNNWFNTCGFPVLDDGWLSNKKGGHFLPRLINIINCIKLRKHIITENPDYIYFASYDLLSFWFVYYLFLRRYKEKIILQEHNNVDQLENYLKKKLYLMYANEVRHFVLEPFIKDRIVSLNVDKSLIHVIPHPLPDPVNNTNNQTNDDSFTIIGLSNSNSEEIIEKIVSLQESFSFLSKLGINMIVKSKNIFYSNGGLVVTNHWILREEYENLIRKSSCILIPFPTTGYSYRISNVFMEAIANNKKIICSKFTLSEYYLKKYPGICEVFSNVEELPIIIDRTRKKEQTNRDEFIHDHNDHRIKKAFDEALTK